MSKMIAIMDNVDNCSDCPLCIKTVGIGWKCNMTKIYMGGLDLTKRPYFCPLKELPEKRAKDLPEYDQFFEGYDEGWNDCVDEILGE